MKFLYDLLPVIFFFATFKFAQGNPEAAAELCNSYLGSGFAADQAPIICATGVAILISLIQIAWKLFKGQKIDPMLWISVAVILVFGSLTIWLHNEMFIKWKPTILYWIFAALLGGGLLFKKNFLKSLLGKQINLPEKAWGTLLNSWITFFVTIGVLNLIVAYSCTTNFWVNFKLFGLLGLTLLFTVGVGFYISRFMPDSDSEGRTK